MDSQIWKTNRITKGERIVRITEEYFVINYNGKESEKEYVYMCISMSIDIQNWITLPYTWNIVNQLFSSVQAHSRVWIFATSWTAVHQTSLSITNSQSLLKFTSIESVMPSNHLILCRPLLLLPSIFPGIRVFLNESVLCIRWPKYWSFSFSMVPSLHGK